MTAPTFAPIGDDTADLLSLIADEHTVAGHDAVTAFLAACKADADNHGGLVSVNRVRSRLAGHDIPPRRYSSLWCAFTGTGKPMHRTGDWEVCDDRAGRNAGRPQPVRRWTGSPHKEPDPSDRNAGVQTGRSIA